jgi:hypothetical protein
MPAPHAGNGGTRHRPDAALRFIESHHLKPGETIEVEERDEVSDSVRLKGRNDQRMTIGARAASKLLVTS